MKALSKTIPKTIWGPMRRRGVGVAVAVLLAGLAACAPVPVEKKAPLELTRVRFDALPGWTTDSQGAALAALQRSCRKGIPDTAATRAVGIAAADWRAPCAAATGIDTGDDGAARAYFERWFRPFRATGGNAPDGLITGYFEAELRGSRMRTGRYTTPIYRLPDDHVSADLAQFDPALKGKRIVGRVVDGRLRPYFTRGDIAAGALAGRGLELFWLDDPIDAFILHVQGSGRVILPDGAVAQIGYAGNNGRPYRSIGRELIARGALKPDAASWQEIRAWIAANPDKAATLLAVNRRFIFFREIAGDGPIGASGVALIPGRSLAVDPRFVPYGLPVWLETTWPNAPDKPLRRLMVAQDTGSAIRGPLRADFFWGYGPDALALAGRMKSRGRFVLLLPRAAAKRVAEG